MFLTEDDKQLQLQNEQLFIEKNQENVILR